MDFSPDLFALSPVLLKKNPFRAGPAAYRQAHSIDCLLTQKRKKRSSRDFKQKVGIIC
jgi:hypothetical protein